LLALLWTTFERAVRLLRTMTLTAIIYPGEETGVMIAQNPETGTTTQGATVEEALGNLREAVALYLAEFPLKERGKPLLTTFDVEPAHA